MYCFLCEGIYVTVCYSDFVNLLHFVTCMRCAVTVCYRGFYGGKDVYGEVDW